MRQATLSPQDIVVLLKILSFRGDPWVQMQLAIKLELSQAEISNSLVRSKYAGLLDASGKVVSKQALMDFLHHGIAYAFPARPGALVRGVPTAHSAAPLNKWIEGGEEEYVWPSATGNMRGQAVSPLYRNVVKAVRSDPEMHELLALVDGIRVGRARERELAVKELRKRLI